VDFNEPVDLNEPTARLSCATSVDGTLVVYLRNCPAFDQMGRIFLMTNALDGAPAGMAEPSGAKKR
jgi:hypothetical protein